MSNAINVRVVSPITTKGFRKDSDFDTIRNSDLNISHSQIEIGPASIETEFDEAMCQPDTILKIIDAENEGCDAAVIDCMGDPGLKGARECVSIPVVGPCETAMHYASMLGHKFTVLTVLERTKPLIENLSKIYGVSSKLASATSVDIPVLELEKDLNYTLKQMTNKAIQTIEKDHSLYPKVTDGRGVAYERIGEWDKAEKDLLSSLEESPDQAYVINYLAY